MVGMFQFAMLNNQIKHDDFQFANSTQKPVPLRPFATAKKPRAFLRSTQLLTAGAWGVSRVR